MDFEQARRDTGSCGGYDVFVAKRGANGEMQETCSNCPSEYNGDGQVTIDEIIKAGNAALHGSCNQ